METASLNTNNGVFSGLDDNKTLRLKKMISSFEYKEPWS